MIRVPTNRKPTYPEEMLLRWDLYSAGVKERSEIEMIKPYKKTVALV